uniref:C-CAP/cofactor C-like domain-containing protein n=1 Tax=Palpitomonas bilix TaxID=652834 RepID=A0A7S3LV17_9EUKA
MVNRDDILMKNKSNEKVVRVAGQIDGNASAIMKADKCEFLICDYISQITVDKVTDSSLFIGPVEGSIFLRNLENCTVTCACGQLRTRDCKNVTIHLYVKTDPIIEASTNMTFRPFNGYYKGIEEHAKKAGLFGNPNVYSKLYDFTPTDEVHFSVEEKAKNIWSGDGTAEADSEWPFGHPEVEEGGGVVGVGGEQDGGEASAEREETEVEGKQAEKEGEKQEKPQEEKEETKGEEKEEKKEEKKEEEAEEKEETKGEREEKEEKQEEKQEDKKEEEKQEEVEEKEEGEKPTVVVTGATGKLGVEIVRQLAMEGYKVRALCRSADKAARVFPSSHRHFKKVEVAVGELSNYSEESGVIESGVREAFAGCKYAVFCHGATSTFGKGSPYNVEVVGTKHVMAAAKEAGIEHIVYVTAVGVMRPFFFITILLNLMRWKIMTHKRTAEKIVMSSGIPCTVVRPTGLTNKGAVSNVRISQGDRVSGGSIPRASVAQVCATAFAQEAKGKTFEITATDKEGDGFVFDPLNRSQLLQHYSEMKTNEELALY